MVADADRTRELLDAVAMSGPESPEAKDLVNRIIVMQNAARARVEKLEAALRMYADESNWRQGWCAFDVWVGKQCGYEIARKALEDSNGEKSCPGVQVVPSLPANHAEVLDSLVRDRDRLIMKRLDEPLSRTEKDDLRYIEWQIDQFECLELKDDLDRLERLVQQQERLSIRQKELADGANNKIKTGKRGN